MLRRRSAVIPFISPGVMQFMFLGAVALYAALKFMLSA